MMKKIIFNIMKKVVVVTKKLFYAMLIVIIFLFIIIYMLFLVYINDSDIDFKVDCLISYIFELKNLFIDPSLSGQKITLFSSSSSTDLTKSGSDSGRPLVPRPPGSTSDGTRLPRPPRYIGTDRHMLPRPPRSIGTDGHIMPRPPRSIAEIPQGNIPEISQNNTSEISQNNVPESSLRRFAGIRLRSEFWWLRHYLTDSFITEHIEGFNVNDANVLQGKENASYWLKSRANDIVKVDRVLNQSGINVTTSMPDSLHNFRIIETYRLKYYVIVDKYYSDKDFSLLEKSLKDFHFKEELFSKNYDIGLKQGGGDRIYKILVRGLLDDNLKLGTELSNLIGRSPIHNPHSISYLINK